MNKAKKIVLGVLGLAAVGTAIYVVVKTSNSTENQSKKNADALSEETENKLNNNPNNAVKTISQAEARSICDTLLEAMNEVGTDTKLIDNVLYQRSTPLQPGDFALIYQNWGWNNPDGENVNDHKVRYGTFGMYTKYSVWTNGTRLTLCQWFREELSESSALYEKIKTSFTQAGCWNLNS